MYLQFGIYGVDEFIVTFTGSNPKNEWGEFKLFVHSYVSINNSSYILDNNVFYFNEIFTFTSDKMYLFGKLKLKMKLLTATDLKCNKFINKRPFAR